MMKLKFLFLLLLIFICGLCSYAQGRITASADKERVIYSEYDPSGNRVDIRISVSGASNRTAIRLVTTLGQFAQPIIYTENGQCIATLYNLDGPGYSDITIINDSNGDQANLRIEFIGEHGVVKAQKREDNVVILTADTMNYSIEEHNFDMVDNCVFEYKNVRIASDQMVMYLDKPFNSGRTYSTKTDYVVAESFLSENPLVLVLNEDVYLARMVIWDKNSDFIRFLDFENHIYDLNIKTTELLSANEIDFSAIMPTAEKTATLVISKKAKILPSRIIIFEKVKFYLSKMNRALYSLPYFVLEITPYGNEVNLFNAEFSLTTDLGLNIHFPIDVYADEKNITTLSFDYVTPGALNLDQKTGMNVSISDEYIIGDTGNGVISLSNALRETRVAHWAHNQYVGSVKSNLNVSYGRTSSDSDYYTRASLSLGQNIGNTALNLNTYVNLFGDTLNSYSELHISPPVWKMTKKTDTSGDRRYTIGNSLYVGWANNKAKDRYGNVTEVVDTYEGLRTYFSFPSYDVGFKNGRITPTISNDVSLRNTGEALIQERLDASLRYTTDFIEKSTASLSYGYSYYTSNNLRNYPERITSYISGSITRPEHDHWQTSLYGSYGFESKTLNSSASLDVMLPFWKSKEGKEMLVFGYAANASSVSGGDVTADHVFSLRRRIGSTGFIIRYSPSGSYAVSGIGTSSGKQWSIELMRVGW